MNVLGRGNRVLGIDIGGANVKYATCDGLAMSRNFPLWRQPERLCDSLCRDIQSCGNVDVLAITMTGELADCFVDREEGVRQIIQHSLSAASQLGLSAPFFYGVDGAFRNADRAREEVDLIAAANWHALASFAACEFAPTSQACLIDIGSTTTDVIPLRNGRVATHAQTDFDRLQEESLVYVGCRRTPVCALVDQFEFRGKPCLVMNELFATIDDARLILGLVAEDSDDCDSADGKPRTTEFAANRMARMIGLDRRQVSIPQSRELATQVIESAKQRIASAVEKHGATSFIISGHGQDLVELPSGCHSLQLSEKLGESSTRCAPSYAVAHLYQSQCAAK
ncbi:MAG: hydantoinase/oxoprolinase family protein [Rubripirellula sp.]